jgi:hypothetical protein
MIPMDAKIPRLPECRMNSMVPERETGGHRRPSLASSNPLPRRKGQKKKTAAVPNPIPERIRKFLAIRFESIGA